MVYINPFNVIYLYNITQRDTIEKEKVFYQYFTSDLVVTPPPKWSKIQTYDVLKIYHTYTSERSEV